MTELRIHLKRRELDYLWRNRETFFAPPTDGSYIGNLVRYRFLEALKTLNLDAEPARSHQRKPPAPEPVTEPDPYAEEPDEDGT